MNIKNLLLQNISIRQTIAKNTFWLAVGEVVVRLCGFALAIYVARALGATEYGKFTFAFSFVSLMAVFSNLGIMDVATREFSRNKENEKSFNALFTLEIVLWLLVLAATFLFSLWVTADHSIRMMIWVLAASLFSTGVFELTFYLARARQNMQYEAVVKMCQAMVNALVVFLVIWQFPSALHVSYAYLFSSILVMAAVLLVFHAFFYRLSFSKGARFWQIVKESWPLGLGFTAVWAYVLADSVMLGFFGMNTENGWFGAASKIALAALVPAELILRSFYPALSDFYVSSKERFQKTWNYFASTMVVLGLPIFAGGVILAPKIIQLFYGQGFMPAAISLQFLLAAVAITFLTCPYSLFLVVSGRQQQHFWVMAAGAGSNIMLNAIFIPWQGLYGVLISSVLAAAVALAFAIFFTYKAGFPIFPSLKLVKELWIGR